MKFTSLDRSEFSKECINIADDFRSLINKHNLQHTELDMMAANDERSESTDLCNTPACHGGWAAILYEAEIEKSDWFFEDGARALARKLGFLNELDYQAWAEIYPDFWGGVNGAFMFESSMAFGDFDSEKHLTLQDVESHYRKMSENVLNVEIYPGV